MTDFSVRSDVVARNDDLEASIDHFQLLVVIGSKRPNLSTVVVSWHLVERDLSFRARSRTVFRLVRWSSTIPLPYLSVLVLFYVAGIDSDSIIDHGRMRRRVESVVEFNSNRLAAIVREIGSANEGNAMVWGFCWRASDDQVGLASRWRLGEGPTRNAVDVKIDIENISVIKINIENISVGIFDGLAFTKPLGRVERDKGKYGIEDDEK